MNPRIPHHKVARASIISESEVSITVLCLLYSPHYTAVRIKNCSKSTSVIIRSSHYEKYSGTAHPSYRLKLKHHCHSLSAMFNSLHCSMNQEVFEKNPCNKSSHYENTDDFSLHKRSHHVQPPN